MYARCGNLLENRHIFLGQFVVSLTAFFGMTFHIVKGALLTKGPDSSLGEVHWGSCSGNKRWKSKFRRMKWKMGETNEECEERVEERSNTQGRDTWMG